MTPTAQERLAIETGKAMKKAFADPATQASFAEWQTLRAELGRLKAENQRLRELLHECRNELCYHCGEYRRNPTCDCKWKEV